MNNQDKFAKSVKTLIDNAQELNKENKEPIESLTSEMVDSEIKRMNDDIELTRNRAENIISRLEAGIISGEVAKKQMKKVLNEECTKMLADLMKYGGISPGLSITEDDIKEAMKKIDRKVLEYTPSEGLLSLRAKLVSYYAKFIFRTVHFRDSAEGIRYDQYAHKGDHARKCGIDDVSEIGSWLQAWYSSCEYCRGDRCRLLQRYSRKGMHQCQAV